MLELKKNSVLDLQLFFFVKEDAKKFEGKAIIGYTVEEVIHNLHESRWIPVGGMPVSKILKDIGFEPPKPPEEEVREFSLSSFKNSLLLTADKYADLLNESDLKTLKRIVKKLP